MDSRVNGVSPTVLGRGQLTENSGETVELKKDTHNTFDLGLWSSVLQIQNHCGTSYILQHLAAYSRY